MVTQHINAIKTQPKLTAAVFSKYYLEKELIQDSNNTMVLKINKFYLQYFLI